MYICIAVYMYPLMRMHTYTPAGCSEHIIATTLAAAAAAVHYSILCVLCVDRIRLLV